DQVLTASTALAGLLLVSIGGVVSAYQSYATDAQPAVLARFRWRGWVAFSGFAISLISALAALASYWIKYEWLTDVSAALLVLALMGALAAALFSVLEIR